MHEGTVLRVVIGKGFGFISVAGQAGDAFFHHADLRDGLEFGESLLERRVKFDVVSGPKGLRARNISAAD